MFNISDLFEIEKNFARIFSFAVKSAKIKVICSKNYVLSGIKVVFLDFEFREIQLLIDLICTG